MLRVTSAYGTSDAEATQYTYDAAGNVIAVTDALGRRTDYAYDRLDRLTSVTAPDPDSISAADPGPLPRPVTSYAYDLAGRQTAATETYENESAATALRTTWYDYDALGRLMQVTAPIPSGSDPTDAPVVQYAYDANGNLVQVRDPLGRITVHQYDMLGRLVYEIQPDPDGAGSAASPVTSYEYDPLGNLTKVTDPRGGVTAYVYDRQQRLIEQRQPDPASGLPAVSTKYAYDAAGQLLSVTDPLDRTTQYGYDAFGRVIRELGPAPAAGQAPPLRSFGYDAADNLRIVVDALRNWTEYRYDQRDRLLAVVEADPDGAGGPLPAPTSSFTYDAAGQLLSSVDPLSRTTRYDYDRLGRTIAVTLPDPDGAGAQLAPQTVSAYDAYGDLIDSRQRLQQPDGTVTGLVTQYAYDRLRRVVWTTDPNQAVTQFAYDLAGNRTQITDPVGNDTTFVYDGLDQVIQEQNELGYSRLYHYDAAGNLIQSTDRNGRTIAYQYDYLNRPDRRDVVRDRLRRLVHLRSGRPTAAGHRPGRQLQLYLRQAGPRDHNHNHPIRLRRSRPGHVDADLRPGRQPHAAGGNARHSLDDDGRLREPIHLRPPEPTDARHAIQHHRWQRRGRKTRGLQLRRRQPNGGHRPLPRPSRHETRRRQHLQLRPRRPPAGPHPPSEHHHPRRLLVDLRHRPPRDHVHRRPAPRRVRHVHLRPRQPINRRRPQRHHRRRNLHLRPQRQPRNYSTGSDNRLLSDGTYTYQYDGEGNRTRRTHIASGEVTDYQWDHRNRLIRVTVRTSDQGPVTKDIQYTYDVFDRRLAKQIDLDGPGPQLPTRESFLYDGQHIALTFLDPDASGSQHPALNHRYLHGPAIDQILADERVTSPTAPGNILWPLTDNLGSVRDVVDLNEPTNLSQVVNHLTYDSFGRITAETNAAVDFLFAYTARDRDEETGLHYYRARYYDPAVGRFLSQDPIAFDAGDANLYRYVFNKTTGSLEPSGNVLVAVDGTGSKKFREGGGGFDRRTGRYRSHTRNFYEDYVAKGGEKKAYWDGPCNKTTGSDADDIYRGVMAYLMPILKANPNETINLIGHSRGGYIVMQVAHTPERAWIQG